MRIAFLGTPEFAVPSLERLVESGFEIAAVVTQPDKPKGRGRHLAAPPVKDAALRLGLPVHQLRSVKNPEAAEFFRTLNVTAMAVVAYGKIIPPAILDIPPLGLVNVHASLLPRYRGAAPMQWAVAEGETLTGVTTMLIDAGLDSGDILLAKETEIGPEENALELSERLAMMGADLLVQTFRALEAGTVRPTPQDHERATFAPMLTREAGLIDWSWPASVIHNRVRGFQPWPGAHAVLDARRFHIWKSRVAEISIDAPPGTLLAAKGRLYAACGENTSLELLDVQLQGRKRMPASAFLNGRRLRDGERLEGVNKQ